MMFSAKQNGSGLDPVDLASSILEVTAGSADPGELQVMNEAVAKDGSHWRKVAMGRVLLSRALEG